MLVLSVGVYAENLDVNALQSKTPELSEPTAEEGPKIKNSIGNSWMIAIGPSYSFDRRLLSVIGGSLSIGYNMDIIKHNIAFGAVFDFRTTLDEVHGLIFDAASFIQYLYEVGNSGLALGIRLEAGAYTGFSTVVDKNEFSPETLEIYRDPSATLFDGSSTLINGFLTMQFHFPAARSFIYADAGVNYVPTIPTGLGGIFRMGYGLAL